MDPSHVSHAENHMATTFEFTISCEPSRAGLASRLLKRAHTEVARLERELSEFHPESPVRLLNESPPGTPVLFSLDGLELLERSLRMARVTEGAFHPLAKSPLEARTEAAIQVDRKSGLVFRFHPRAHLGFGAIGKGFALDRVRLLLEAEGFHDFQLVAGGSSIVLSGQAAPGAPWPLAWSWAKAETGNPLGIQLSHQAGACVSIGVSGVEEKGAHIVAQTSDYTLRSVFVAAQSAADADALSTAVFASGWEPSERFLRQILVAPALAAVERDGSVRWNGLFQKIWGPLEPPHRTQRSTQPLFALAALASLGLLSQNQAYADEPAALDEGAVDLDSMGADSFNPYVFSRDSSWVLLPLFALVTVLIHLRGTRRIKMKPHVPQQNTPSKATTLLAIIALWAQIEKATATEFEKKGAAIGALLGTKKDVRAVPGVKNGFHAGGKVVFVESGIYDPNCTHTWAIGMDKTKGTVNEIRVIEMSCTHAFPTRAASFLDQFKGMGPKDLTKLNSTTTIAKATGSSILTRDAVKRAIKSWSTTKGKY